MKNIVVRYQKQCSFTDFGSFDMMIFCLFFSDDNVLIIRCTRKKICFSIGSSEQNTTHTPHVNRFVITPNRMYRFVFNFLKTSINALNL